MSKNTEALIEYLSRYKINAHDVIADSVTENGYEVYKEDGDGSRRLYTTRDNTVKLKRETREWPNPVVYENVLTLIGGGTLAELKPDPKEEQPAPKEPAKVTTKNSKVPPVSPTVEVVK